MSENVQWRVLPWEWQTVPEFWLERMFMYFSAVVEVKPILEEKRRRRAQQYG